MNLNLLRSLLPCLLLAPLLALLPTGAGALASTDSDRPYQVQVCLRFSPDPILTPLFARAVSRQVQDQLTNYLGPLAQVEVLATDHWLLDQYAHQAIDQPPLTPELLAEQQLPDKIFLVGIDYRDGLYQLSWRQIDGQMQQADPARSRATPDRQWVAKAICLAVKHDFSPVAVLQPDTRKYAVRLQFRGSRWKSRLADLLGEPCVLQPLWVVRQPSGQVTRIPIPHTLLLVRPEDGISEARVVSNLSDPWKRTARVAGFEAIKVNTQPGRLRLQLVDSASGASVLNCRVYANDQGFDRFEDRHILDSPDRHGVVLSRRPLQHIAYLKVSQGSGAAVQLPVPITSDVCRHVIKVPVDRAATAKADFQRQLGFLVQDLQTLQALRADGVSEVNRLNGNKRYEEAVKHVRTTAELISPLLKNARAAHTALRRQAEQLKLPPNSLLQAARQQLDDIDNRYAELLGLGEKLNQTIATRDAQSRANVLIELAQQAEQQGDIDEAITRLELALQEQPNQPELRKKLEAMKQTWAIQSPAHERARQTVYQQWGEAEVTELQAALPEAQSALKTLRALGDHLTLRKLSAVNSQHLGELNALVERLARRDSPADRADGEKYAELTQQVADFQQQVAQARSELLNQPDVPQEEQ